MGKKGEHFLLKECQLLTIVEMMELENQLHKDWEEEQAYLS